MRWPFMLKKTRDAEVDFIMDIYQGAVDREYFRATEDGSAKVRAWAVEANFNVYNHPVPRGAAMAAFQEAQSIFRADPVTFKEVLEGAQ